MKLWPSFFPLLLHVLFVFAECGEGRSALSRRIGARGGGGGGGGDAAREAAVALGGRPLRFGKMGKFKILQVADMHYADGRETGCLDVFPDQLPTCSDLNTTAFIYRVIRAENPDLVIFTGDNIFGFDSKDAAKSLDAAFAPAVALKLPWAAVLGNHDQEGTLSREGVMQHIVGMRHTLSHLNPSGKAIDGFGNYNLEIGGTDSSALANKSVLNLYFLDSGDYSTVPAIPGYGWIKPTQQVWFQQTSSRLQKEYMSKPLPQKDPAPGLVYFHIPLPEYSAFDASNFTGVKQEGISSPSINSGFFTTMVEAGDVKAVFTGHDHLNDFCGKLTGIQLCYAGGFGYHAYGKAGWSRRARVVSAYLETTVNGEWGGVKSIKTWKRLDDEYLSTIDNLVLWNKGSTGSILIGLRSLEVGASKAWCSMVLRQGCCSWQRWLQLMRKVDCTCSLL